MTDRHPNIHPAALVFPEMTGTALQELADDIKQNGLAYPIIRDTESVILDGRNRLKACEVAGVEPRFETYKGTNPIGFIVSANLKRRHLDASQRAMAAKLATLKHGGDRRSDQAANDAARTQAQAAAMLNVSERSIRHATIVRDSGKPDLIKDVEQGKISVSAAAKQAKPPPPPKPQPKPSPKPEAKPPRRFAFDITPIKNAFQLVEKAFALRDDGRVQQYLRELAQAVREAIK